MMIIISSRNIITALFLFTFLITGCGISELGRPPPPEAMTWHKAGWSLDQIDIELNACFREGRAQGVGFNELFDVADLCMLRKGFEPRPSSSGWPDVCRSGSMGYNRVRCKAYRGELNVVVEKVQPEPHVIDTHMNSEVLRLYGIDYTRVNKSTPSEHQLIEKVTPQVQKDSNNQMNQLLEGTNPHK